MSDTVEGTGTDVEGLPTPDAPPVEPPGPTSTSTALAQAAGPASREALVPLDADQVVQGMEAYQQLLPRLLDESDYQQAGNKKFVKKSGWRKIARAFNLSVDIVSLRVERDELGHPQRAEAVVRAIAPNGQSQGADGYCSIDEERFTSDRANLSKVENDLRTTATTRAKNRAIADLVGMGEVSAEEVDGRGDSGPRHGPPASDELKRAMWPALRWLADVGQGPDEQLASDAIHRVIEELGYLPSAAASALLLTADTIKRASDG